MPNRLKELLEEQRMTMREVAIKLDTYDATISRLANGQQTMTDYFAIKFADLFNVSLDYFLCRSDKKEAFTRIEIRETPLTYKNMFLALNTLTNDELLKLSGGIDYILDERRKQKNDLPNADRPKDTVRKVTGS